jgi:hypothetical protein
MQVLLANMIGVEEFEAFAAVNIRVLGSNKV